jgi:hypothetical protein
MSGWKEGHDILTKLLGLESSLAGKEHEILTFSYGNPFPSSSSVDSGVEQVTTNECLLMILKQPFSRYFAIFGSTEKLI